VIDAQLPLQAAIVAVVKASDVLKGLVADRIYDRVPTDTAGKVSATFPYLSFGPFSTDGLGGSCDTGQDIYVQIDGWSRAVGTVEAKRINAALMAVLLAPFPVEGFQITLARLAMPMTVQPGRDGLTSQSILRLRFSLSPSA